MLFLMNLTTLFKEEERGSVDDDVGLNFSMGRLQIEDKDSQQEKEMDSKNEEQSPLALPPLPQLE